MNDFQGITRKEIVMLTSRMTYLEQLTDKLNKNMEYLLSIEKGKNKDDWTRVVEYLKVFSKPNT
jgi:phage-related protein